MTDDTTKVIRFVLNQLINKEPTNQHFFSIVQQLKYKFMDVSVLLNCNSSANYGDGHEQLHT
jgi:hypothetical protein